MSNLERERRLEAAFDDAFEEFKRDHGGDTPRGQLKLSRRILGMSQREFAEAFGLSPMTVRNWEANSRPQPSGVAEAFIRIVSSDPELARILHLRAHTCETPKTSASTAKSTDNSKTQATVKIETRTKTSAGKE